MFIRFEKTLQGDKYDPIELYQPDVPEKHLHSLRDYQRHNENVLSSYKMQFLWTFVAFAGLKKEKFGKNQFEMDEDGSLIVEDANTSGDFVPKKGTIDFSINQLFRMDNDRLSDEKICAQIVEVCKNQRAYDKRSISCDFSLSIGKVYSIKDQIEAIYQNIIF